MTPLCPLLATIVSERFRECRPDGTEGEVLRLERPAEAPPPQFHPVSGHPLRRLIECCPRDDS